MITRNEWIAETAAKVFCSLDRFDHDTVYEGCVENAVRLADSLEFAGCAPWIADDETPEPSDALSKLPRIALFDLDISPKIAPKGAVRRLVGQGFGTVNDLAAVTRRDVAMCCNIGESTLRFCDAALAACGLNWKAKDRA